MVRVAFIVTTCHEFEGIKVLSAMIKQRGWDADCFITSEEQDFHQAVLDYQPDVLGIYSTTGQENWALDLVRSWRKELTHLKVVMGGPHASFDANVLLEEDYVDAIVKAEAEYAILDLIDAWSAGRSIDLIPNIGFLEDGKPHVNAIRPAVQDLDSLPFPDVDVFYKYLSLIHI